MEPTREIYGNIVGGELVYLAMVISFGLVGWALYRHYCLWMQGRPDNRVQALWRRLKVMLVQGPAYQAKRYHHGQVDQLATNNIAVDFSRRFHSPLTLLIRCLPFSNVDWHIITQQQITGVEKIFALVRGQGKDSRIHANGVARARFHT